MFVGYGVEDALLKLDDYRGLDVKGKIVVALRGFPKGMPSEEGAHLAAIKARRRESMARSACVTVDTMQSEKAVPWKRVLRVCQRSGLRLGRSPMASSTRTRPAIRVGACSMARRPRRCSPAARALSRPIRAEADRAESTPRGFALKTRVRDPERELLAARHAARTSSRSCAAPIPRSPTQYVVLLAHLDHLGVEQPWRPIPPDKDRIHNGALDNAAGIATMLEVARAAAVGAHRPRRSMLFLATTAEEKGLLGADYFARHPTVPIRQIVGAVGLDMPLLLYPFTDVIAFGANHSSFGKLVAQAVAPMQIELAPDPMPEQGVFTRSDHYPFVKQGVPAVFLVTGLRQRRRESRGMNS